MVDKEKAGKDEPKEAVEGRKPQPVDTPRHPAAGPHDKPHLTNEDATPGAGTLPKPGNSKTPEAPSG